MQQYSTTPKVKCNKIKMYVCTSINVRSYGNVRTLIIPRRNIHYKRTFLATRTRIHVLNSKAGI